LNKLIELLDSIESQTILPSQVVVSCSSTNFEVNKSYSFPLQIITTKENKNAAQNRNIAAKHLPEMDYITFMDADDIMHPQRIEILMSVIELHNSEIILHNYTDSEPMEPIDTIQIDTNTLIQCGGGITHIDKNESIFKIHRSQVTIKDTILEQVKFPEEECFHAIEDSVFCNLVFNLNVTHAYISNKLSFYKKSYMFPVLYGLGFSITIFFAQMPISHF
jgi:glycosyltransferase involved in cell wall biosynthesis